jgi:hypothetical protein
MSGIEMTKKRLLLVGGVVGLAGLWINAAFRTHQPSMKDSAPSPQRSSPSEILAPNSVVRADSDGVPVRSNFEPPKTDPFAVIPLPPVKVSLVAAPTPPVQPPAPQAPPVNLRIVGRASSEGSLLAVYAMDGTRFATLTAGSTLSTGHQVREVTNSSVELTHPLLEQPISISLPPAPKQEIR